MNPDGEWRYAGLEFQCDCGGDTYVWETPSTVSWANQMIRCEECGKEGAMVSSLHDGSYIANWNAVA